MFRYFIYQKSHVLGTFERSFFSSLVYFLIFKKTTCKTVKCGVNEIFIKSISKVIEIFKMFIKYQQHFSSAYQLSKKITIF